MKVNAKWLIAAPALGALLVLGPMVQSRLSGAPNTPSTAGAAEPSASGATRPEVGSNATPLPDAWKVLSTLAGLLILGGVGIVALSRSRKPRATGTGAPLIVLRQSLRLGPKSRLHAVQFDGHVLLVGESERGLDMLRDIEDPAAADDEAEILAREEPTGGAEPRDLALLQAARRMAQASQGRAARAPSEKKVTIPRPETQAAATAARPARAASNRTLEEFHALLRKAKAEKAS